MQTKSRRKAGDRKREDKAAMREGLKQRDPREAQKMLDDAIAASMPTSDAIAVVIPDVKLRPDTDDGPAAEKKK